VRPQVVFSFDGFRPFLPLGTVQAPIMFEGGLNWLIANHVNFYLVLHAAVIERGGRAVIMPADAGAGKSTLCAALVNRGWRLLSDEFALISFADGKVAALARPISLKNRSIDIIRDLVPDSVLSAPIENTTKGTVAFLKPPLESVRRMDEPAVAAWIIAPTYVHAIGAVLEPKSKAESFKHVIDNAYNYHLFGRRGFTLLADLLDRCDCYDFRYGNLDEAIGVFDRLAAAAP
jgi:HprK-related kinase A